MYKQLTIHQKISLKSLFISSKERIDIGLIDTDSHRSLDSIYAIMKLWNFKIAIEYFLTNDENLLKQTWGKEL